MIRLFSFCFVIGLALALSGLPTQGQELTSDDYIQFWEPVMGSWKMTNDRSGTITTGTFRIEFAPNRKCILLYHGGEKDPFTQQLQGYDPVGKKQIAFGFVENGNFQIQTITVDGMRKGLKAAKGVGGNWEQKIFSPDGKTTTFTSKWKWTHLDKDKIVMMWTDIKQEGKPETEELTMTLERRK